MSKYKSRKKTRKEKERTNSWQVLHQAKTAEKMVESHPSWICSSSREVAREIRAK
jgi:hypothetical protein